ncbi:MAG: tRNA pseudouridine(38-40) synthase TruA [Acidobacteria bacterium]|nr:tRNA pseudouridine(38-40) synthase TruA [Acidobacteriota bacterium]
MPKWKLFIEYQGTRYRGWQEQTNARTVQGEIRAAVEGVFDEKVEIIGAGRTDAGVHALRQVAHLRARKFPRTADLRNQINDRLPQDISIKEIREADSRFHARHDAVERFYLYQISTRRRAFSKPFVWWIKDRLNVQDMIDAADLLPGRHDFGAFSDRDEEGDSTIVEVTRAEIRCRDDLILIRIGASHFLWKMVRRVVGTLVEVGRGNVEPRGIADFLKMPASSVAQWTAPPSGLFLEYVRYQGDRAPAPIAPAFFFRS